MRRRLSQPDEVSRRARVTFDPACVADLPTPVQRWLRHAIAPGSRLLSRTTLLTKGQIRVGGRWAPFRARAVLTPPLSFLWRARVLVPVGPVPLLPVVGFDRYSAGTGQMDWRAVGIIPVVRASGGDVTRSAAGRLAAESIFAPAFALSDAVRWREIDETHAAAAVDIGRYRHDVVVTVAASGALESCSTRRWGDPDGAAFKEHAFGAVFDGEHSVDGYTVPAAARAGWWYGEPRWKDGEFIRFRVLRADHW